MKKKKKKKMKEWKKIRMSEEASEDEETLYGFGAAKIFGKVLAVRNAPRLAPLYSLSRSMI